MEVKLLEIRDRATFIPAIAISCLPANDDQRYLLRRAGYSCNDDLILFGYLQGGKLTYDVYDWNNGSRTMQVAHNYAQQHFNELKDGDVIDVEFILKETNQPKTSERHEVYE
jgi:hypothetical protein